MKKLTIAVSIVLLLAIYSSCSPVVAQPTHIPHENPATAKGSPGLALLRFYANVYELGAARQYQNAQAMLEEVKHVTIPADLRDIMDSYYNLSQQLITSLNNLEGLLNEVSTLFSHNQSSDAKQKLDEAKTIISSAQFLLEDIETATDTIADELGVLTSVSQIREAHERQQQNLYQLGQLIRELDQLRESLGLNPRMAIRTQFYHPTLLEVSAPETAYPGLPVTISGQVGSAEGTVGRLVKVFLDNTQLAEEIVQDQFSLEITPPQQISTGRHDLTLVVIPQGLYAGASESLPINISVIPIRTEVQVPLLTVIPKKFQINGQVYRGLTPVEGAKISFVFKESTTIVRTSADGSFTTTIEVPFDLSLFGPQELTMTIEPVEPWYASLEIKRGVFIINPAGIGVMLVAFICLGLLLNRARTRFPGPQEEMAIPQAKLPELPTVASARRKYEFTGIKGRILSAYLKGLGAVEKKTAIPMTPDTTPREFVNAACPLLTTAIKPFTELTAIAENVLYSSHRFHDNTAVRAELLAGIIKEELA